MVHHSAHIIGDGTQQNSVGSELSLNKGTLYLISTPIGNIDDITLRAISVLHSVMLIVAEDRRVIDRLLTRHSIDAEVCSLRARSHCSFAYECIVSTLTAGHDVAVVCDAGTPLIADPGVRLVKAAIEMRCRIVPVPGATTAIAALTASGLSTQRFAFDGFPPRAKSDRFQFFSALATEERTIVLYETRSYLLRNTLRCLANDLGDDRQIAVMRDLTRATETAYRGCIRDMVDQFVNTPPRGEYVLVIEGLGD